MIPNQKKHKDVIFHKVNFRNAKRFNKNKSPNEMISLKTNYFTSNSKEKDKSFQSSAMDNLIKNIEDKYSIFENNNLIKIPKRRYSSKKTNNNKIFNKGKEENKNERNYQFSKFLKIGRNLSGYKRYNSSNRINQFKKFSNGNKDLNSLENEQETYCNNISKEKKKKTKKKNIEYQKNKLYKEEKEKKVRDNFQVKEKYENFVNKRRNNLLCCL